MEFIKSVLESNILAGLISGLTVTFIVLVISRFWNSVVEPWFEEKVYKDLHIEGKWYSLYVSSRDLRQEVINIRRAGHAIEGIMMCKTGADDGEEYCLSGSFRNMLLPLTYEAIDKSKSDRGTITLRSVHNGERLEGRVALYNTKRDSISTSMVVWFRDKAELDKQVSYIKAHREEVKNMEEKGEELAEELKEFFETYWEEYRKNKEKEKEKTIEGESYRIEDQS